MFSVLLITSLLCSLLVCIATIALLRTPITSVLEGRLSPVAASLWKRTILLTICVVGLSVGARVWNLERFLELGREISLDVVMLEAYKTLIATAQANLAVVLVITLAIGVVALMKRHEDPKNRA